MKQKNNKQICFFRFAFEIISIGMATMCVCNMSDRNLARPHYCVYACLVNVNHPLIYHQNSPHLAYQSQVC